MGARFLFSVLKSIVMGYLTTIVSGYYVRDAGDYVFHGLPFPFSTSTLGIGFGEFELVISNFITDIFFWSICWIILINAKVWFRTQNLNNFYSFSFKNLTKNKWLRQILTFLFLFVFIFLLLSYLIEAFSFTYNRSILISLIIAIFYTYIVYLPCELSGVWVNRTILYSFLFMLTAFVIAAVLLFTGFLSTNQNSARYMISALIQSEAAILAIVISLTLVGVQQTSSSYSTRIIDVFKRKNPDLWILLFIYISSMAYGLLALKQIGETGFNHSKYSISAFIFGTFSLVALIPYMWNTIDLLNPSKIMKLLSENITKKNFLSSVHEAKINPDKFDGDFFSIVRNEYKEEYNFYKTGEKVIFYEKDPIQPMVDIVRGSLRTHDFKTAKYGLKLIDEKINYILNYESIDKVHQDILLRYLIDVYTEIGYFAIEMRDVDSTIQIVLNLRTVTIHSIYEIFPTITNLAISSIKKFETDEKDRPEFWKANMCIHHSMKEINELME